MLRKVPGAGLVGRAADGALDRIGVVSPRGRRLAVYAGAGVLGVAGLVEWPVALTGAAVAWLTQSRSGGRREQDGGDNTGKAVGDAAPLGELEAPDEKASDGKASGEAKKTAARKKPGKAKTSAAEKAPVAAKTSAATRTKAGGGTTGKKTAGGTAKKNATGGTARKKTSGGRATSAGKAASAGRKASGGTKAAAASTSRARSTARLGADN
ncbi:hypothetical protein GCM10010365_17610 [Streptomyces poonensis]|uniref:Uncharacterized protein n=1 Tax=Streptomyces poonensis TaxID=68255 RepID=A0A918PCK2_9ACTN|nr:hypothetical protein GCM10010365_17610 [Streptomyces poonensis]